MNRLSSKKPFHTVFVNLFFKCCAVAAEVARGEAMGRALMPMPQHPGIIQHSQCMSHPKRLHWVYIVEP